MVFDRDVSRLLICVTKAVFAVDSAVCKSVIVAYVLATVARMSLALVPIAVFTVEIADSSVDTSVEIVFDSCVFRFVIEFASAV